MLQNNPTFQKLAAQAKKDVYTIPLELYRLYNVKRGLRNEDGTGVLVGLTNIGAVHGYIVSEGEKEAVPGQLFYRGIDVQDIVNACIKEDRHGFEEIIYLLLFGRLPKQEELDEFTKLLISLRSLPENFTEDMILKAPSKSIMNKLARCVLASYSYDDNPDDTSFENVLRQVIELIARFPAMVAYSYQVYRHYYHKESLVIHPPSDTLDTACNFLQMIRSDRCYSKLEADTLDLLLILHAEHGGGNNSAFATHVIASTGTDTYSAIAAAVGSLKGPKHGGANERVMSMMEDIKRNVKDWSNEKEVADYIVKILRKEAFDRSGLVYGMGHAVYTLSDPRAVMLKEKARQLAKDKNMEEEFHLYELIEKLTPGLFKEVKNDSKIICANVDFYSGFVYKMLNMPEELYTPLFAISRIAGWSAHLLEEIVAGQRIMRPAYKSIAKKSEYVNIKDR